MAKTDTLDIAVPAAILELGEVISARGVFRRPSPRQPGCRPPDTDRSDAIVDALLVKLGKDAVARRLFGLRRGMDRDSARMRLKAVAVLGWQALRLSADPVDLAELAAVAADSGLPTVEGLLRARHEIGLMVAEDALIGLPDRMEGPICKAHLPAGTMQFLAGGRRSMGALTLARLSGILSPKGDYGDERKPATTEATPIPTVRDLQAKISEKVIGLDRQVMVLSSLLVMHLARARVIRAGRDAGTNLAILLVSSSGCGKTWLLQTAGDVAQCPFASMSATAMTSEAFIGGKIDDLFKALVVKAKGDVQTARFGIAFTDEWDAKAAEGLSVGGHTSGGNGREANTLCIQQEFLVPMQGAEFIISGKRSMERPIMFDSRGTFFAFAGAFAGLSELIRKKNGQACIGFATPAGTRTKKREYILDAISEYGYLKTWTNRLSALIFLPDPTQRSLEIAASHGVLDSTNAILGELGIQLFPHPNAIPRMAEFALESRAFYRGLKSVWWSLAESAVSAGAKGTVMVTAADVDAAIARVSSGSAGLTDKPGQATQPTQEESNADDFLAGGSAGG